MTTLTDGNALQFIREADATAYSTGRAQNLLASGVPGQMRMVEDDELKDWPLFEVLYRAEPRVLMSCGHRADTITNDTLAPFCSECHNVETMVEE